MGIYYGNQIPARFAGTKGKTTTPTPPGGKGDVSSWLLLVVMFEVIETSTALWAVRILRRIEKQLDSSRGPVLLDSYDDENIPLIDAAKNLNWANWCLIVFQGLLVVSIARHIFDNTFDHWLMFALNILMFAYLLYFSIGYRRRRRRWYQICNVADLQSHLIRDTFYRHMFSVMIYYCLHIFVTYIMYMIESYHLPGDAPVIPAPEDHGSGDPPHEFEEF